MATKTATKNRSSKPTTAKHSKASRTAKPKQHSMRRNEVRNIDELNDMIENHFTVCENDITRLYREGPQHIRKELEALALVHRSQFGQKVIRIALIYCGELQSLRFYGMPYPDTELGWIAAGNYSKVVVQEVEKRRPDLKGKLRTAVMSVSPSDLENEPGADKTFPVASDPLITAKELTEFDKNFQHILSPKKKK